MSSHDTLSVFNNMTITIYNGVDPPQGAVKENHYKGVITFSALFNQSGVFSIVVYSYADLNGTVYATALIPVSVISPLSVFSATLTGPSSILVNRTVLYAALISNVNGISLSSSQLSGFANNSILQVWENGHIVKTLTSSLHANSTVFFSLNVSIPSNYSLLYQGSYQGSVLNSIMFVQVIGFAAVSHNLYLTLTGPSDVQKNVTTVYTVTMAISSGQKMFTPTQQQTLWLMNNATIVLFLNGVISQVLTSSIKYDTPGEFTISVRISNLSTGYSILVTVQNSTLVGSYMWGRESQSLTVVPMVKVGIEAIVGFCSLLVGLPE